MVDLASIPAFWGFCGALFYAGTQLTTALWGGEAAITPAARNIALARFGLALFFGPVAAEAGTRHVVAWSSGSGSIPAVGLAIGLSATKIQDLVEAPLKLIRREFAGFLKRLGSAIEGGEQ